MPEPILFDLGDFIPEEYEFRFSVHGNPYVVRFEEAHVDEVLKMILSGEGTGIDGQRKTVTTFCQNHLSSGDKDQLAKDLERVPYTNKKGLSIQLLMDKINNRVKKNDPGENPKERTPRSGSRETSRS